MTARAAKIAKISCDGFAQIGVAVARSVLEQVCSFLGKNLCPQTFPNFHGKLIECCDRGNEGDARRTCYPKIKFFSGTFIGKVANPPAEVRASFPLQVTFVSTGEPSGVVTTTYTRFSTPGTSLP